MKKIFIASDHAGVMLKEKIVKEIRHPQFLEHGPYEIVDLGPFSEDSVDYPDYADQVCKKIHGFTVVDPNNAPKDQAHSSHLMEAGILICGSGQGMAMRANKYPQIRAAMVWSEETARLSREHNDANVLVLGSRVLDSDLCLRIVKTFFATGFAGGRHAGRVLKISNSIER